MTSEKSVIITGGAGFIGSHLAEHYCKKGYKVIVIDDFSRGIKENLQNINADYLEVFNFDISEKSAPEKIKNIIIDYQPNFLFHYGAVNGTQHFYDSPAKVQYVNSVGTLNVVDAINQAEMCSHNTPILVFASTSEVYGPLPSIPTSENEPAIVHISAARDSYAAAKLMSEFYVKFGLRDRRDRFIILRIFNVYGSRMVSNKYGQVVPEFIARLKQGENPLKIIGDGSQTRSFCFVTDHVRAVGLLAESEASLGKVINIGNPYEITICDLAEKIQLALGVQVGIEYSAPRPDDTVRRCPDIGMLRRIVGEFHFTSLGEGLAETVASFK